MTQQYSVTVEYRSGHLHVTLDRAGGTWLERALAFLRTPVEWDPDRDFAVARPASTFQVRKRSECGSSGTRRFDACTQGLG